MPASTGRQTPYFIKTETDPTGGNTYTITGVSQLLSTPYALYAKTSGSSIPGPAGAQGLQGAASQGGVTTAGTNVTITVSGTMASPYIINAGLTSITQVQRDALIPIAGLAIYNTTTNRPNYYNGTEWMHYDNTSAATPVTIGMAYRGGIVAYILTSNDPGYDANTQHGLIATPADLAVSVWSNSGTDVLGTSQNIGTGNANTNLIVAATIAENGTNAAKLCSDLMQGGYSDWYLPSLTELRRIYENRAIVGGFVSDEEYWSSSSNIASEANTIFLFLNISVLTVI